MEYIYIILGIAVLGFSANLLVNGANSIALNYGISKLAIGLTLVAFSTSFPELVVNLVAAFKSQPDIVFGNIIGSNTANLLLILGISGVISPFLVKKNFIFKEILFSLFGAIILAIFGYYSLVFFKTPSVLGITAGIFLVLIYIFFLAYSLSSKNLISQIDKNEKALSSAKLAYFNIFISIFGLYFGGNWLITGATELATNFGIPQTLIGVSIISIGTSIPELISSVLAALKKKNDIAIGNIIGSNILNIFGILGITSIFKPLLFNFSNLFYLDFLLFASILVIFLLFIKPKYTLSRYKSLILILAYVLFIFLSVII